MLALNAASILNCAYPAAASSSLDLSSVICQCSQFVTGIVAVGVLDEVDVVDGCKI